MITTSSLRLANTEIPAFHLSRREPQKLSKSGYVSLSQALGLYLRSWVLIKIRPLREVLRETFNQ
jgi:hypothetical protein